MKLMFGKFMHQLAFLTAHTEIKCLTTLMHLGGGGGWHSKFARQVPTVRINGGRAWEGQDRVCPSHITLSHVHQEELHLC